jgi:hypothetical protein
MTGKLTISAAGEGLEVANANVSYQLSVKDLKVTTNTLITADANGTPAGQVVLDSFDSGLFASAKYFVQANNETDYHTTELILVQDATNVYITEYGSIQTGASLGTFSADIQSSNVRLLFNATGANNTVRSVRYGIVV